MHLMIGYKEKKIDTIFVFMKIIIVMVIDFDFGRRLLSIHWIRGLIKMLNIARDVKLIEMFLLKMQNIVFCKMSKPFCHIVKHNVCL